GNGDLVCFSANVPLSFKNFSTDSHGFSRMKSQTVCHSEGFSRGICDFKSLIYSVQKRYKWIETAEIDRLYRALRRGELVLEETAAYIICSTI
ncbi:MAG: hypothetical protein KDH97_21350, partial [Calditrichaeota bacterium]|nr:hypothetical protein [Calditrichota bacterium]